MEHSTNMDSGARADPGGFDPRLLDHAGRLAAALGFEPVPLRRRRDGWTPERQIVYHAMLAAGASPREAARRVGMTPQGAGRLLNRPDAARFASACAAAYRMGEPTRRAAAVARRERARAAALRAKVSSPPGSRTFETQETSAGTSGAPGPTAAPSINPRPRAGPARPATPCGARALAGSPAGRYAPPSTSRRRRKPC